MSESGSGIVPAYYWGVTYVQDSDRKGYEVWKGPGDTAITKTIQQGCKVNWSFYCGNSPCNGDTAVFSIIDLSTGNHLHDIGVDIKAGEQTKSGEIVIR